MGSRDLEESKRFLRQTGVEKEYDTFRSVERNVGSRDILLKAVIVTRGISRYPDILRRI